MSARHSLIQSTPTALYDGYYKLGDYRSTGLRWKLKEITMSIAGIVVADRPETWGRYSGKRRGRGGRGWASKLASCESQNPISDFSMPLSMPLAIV